MGLAILLIQDILLVQTDPGQLPCGDPVASRFWEGWMWFVLLGRTPRMPLASCSYRERGECYVVVKTNGAADASAGIPALSA